MGPGGGTPPAERGLDGIGLDAVAREGIDWGLDDAVAVVTGGGAGLGRACAEALAGCGSTVALLERDPDRGTEVAGEIVARGGRAVSLACDVRDAAAVARAVGEVVGLFGGVTHLVNNVGGVFAQPFAASTPRAWTAMWRSNVESALLVTHALLPHLAAGGAVVNLTTVEAHRAAPGYAVYGACKAALASITRSLALELAPDIRVNAVAPDLVITEGIRAMLPEGVEPRADHVPLRRAGRPEEVAHVVLFLLSPLSSYVTGTTIPVDGGTLAAGGWVPDGAGGYTVAPR